MQSRYLRKTAKRQCTFHFHPGMLGARGHMNFAMVALGVLAAYIFKKMFRKGRAMTLVLAAAIYVGFAVTQQNIAVTLMTLVGFLAFSGMALLGRVSFWWLAAGWTLHAVWDLVLHVLKPEVFVPSWYGLVCLGFDVALAGFIVYEGLHPPLYQKR